MTGHLLGAVSLIVYIGQCVSATGACSFNRSHRGSLVSMTLKERMVGKIDLLNLTQENNDFIKK